MRYKLRTKNLFILIFVGVTLSLFLMAILEDGKLDQNVFGIEKVSIRNIYIDDIPMQVMIADTAEKRKTGLSGRNNLQEGQGMLFIFEKPDFHGIWMKNMNFPIDIMWIDEELNIVDLKSSVEPESYPKVFRPMQKSLYIVETMAGFLNTNDIRIGERMILKIF